MTLRDLLEIIVQREIELEADGDRLRYRAPTGALDEDLKRELRRHKPEILAGLRHAILDRHVVCWVWWATDKMVIFEDEQGQTWRYLHKWSRAWPVTISKLVQ